MWESVKTNLGNCRFLLPGFYCMENRKTIVKLRRVKQKPNAPTKRHRQPLRTLKPNNLTTFKPQPYLKIYLKLYKQNPATCIFNLLPATGHVWKGWGLYLRCFRIRLVSRAYIHLLFRNKLVLNQWKQNFIAY